MVDFIYNIEQLDQVAKQLNKIIESCTIITFVGPLGAGKTTLIRALLQARGVTDIVTSPTFSYVNTYIGHGTRFFHFDLYRLEDVHQFIAAGFDEYLQHPNSVVFIEWPEIISSLLEHLHYCQVSIDYMNNNRLLTVKKYEKY